MALTFDVDGTRTENPGTADIASAFQSLGKESGFFKGPGISIIVLETDETHQLTATGTYAAGFLLSYQDGDPDCVYNIEPEQGIPVDEAVRAFQAYARGEDWGQSKFKWEPFQLHDKTSSVIKRILLIAAVGFLAYVLLKHFTAK